MSHSLFMIRRPFSTDRPRCIKISLVLLYLSTICASVPVDTQAPPPPQKLGFVHEPNGRGTVGLIWSCLFTWFICLWQVIHPNVPATTDTEAAWLVRKIGCMVLGAVAPEMIVSMAFTQWRNARRFVAGMERLQRHCHLPIFSTPSAAEGGEMESYNLVKRMRALPLDHWKMSHGFYCVMGGFVITNGEGKTFAVNDQQLIWLVESGYAELPEMAVEAIEDKSKADSLIKSIAAMQATWFVAQCAGRWAQMLTTSTLEITTIGYVFCTLPALILWWHKPVDIKVPTVLRVKHWSNEATQGIRKLDPLTRVFIWTNRNRTEFPRAVNTVEIDDYRGDRPFRSLPNWIPMVAVGALYGLVHCIAWNFDFSSVAEQWAWRICALYLILVSCLSALKYSIWHFIKCSESRDKVTRVMEQYFLIFYIFARLYLSLEVFISFRALPAGVYQTVNWSTYFPRL